MKVTPRFLASLFIGIFIPSTLSKSQSIKIITKKYLDPCVTLLTQVHCDKGQATYEDYESTEECDPIQTDDCDRTRQLFCHSGACLSNCHPVKEEYDPEAGKCFRKIGAECSASTECGVNAVCGIKGFCLCAKQFTIDPQTGKCVKHAEYGAFCNSSMVCDILGDIACRNNVCECRAPSSQFYHERRKRCFLKVGEDCRNTPKSFQFCPDNSDCVHEYQDESGDSHFESYLGILEEEEEKTFRCTCKTGYATTKDGKYCLGLNGTECNSHHRCNTDRSLKCYSTTKTCYCARPKDQVYMTDLQACVTLISKPCTEGVDTCVNWAECKRVEEDTKEKSRCQCGTGLSAAFDDKVCLKDHQQNCSRSEDHEPNCNFFVGLECSNITHNCQCKEPQQFYDARVGTCRDFEITRRIPAIHYNTSDREYLLRYGNGALTSYLSIKEATFVSVVTYFYS